MVQTICEPVSLHHAPGGIHDIYLQFEARVEGRPAEITVAREEKQEATVFNETSEFNSRDAR